MAASASGTAPSTGPSQGPRLPSPPQLPNVDIYVPTFYQKKGKVTNGSHHPTPRGGF